MSAPKILGSVNLSAATAANVFASPASGATFSVAFCNRGSAAAKVKLGFSTTSATFDNALYLEYEADLPAKSVLERTGLNIENNYYLVAESDSANVNVVATGWEIS